MNEIKNSNSYEVQIRQGRKIIAHMSCSHTNGEVKIRDLYVLPKYRGKGLGEVLLAKCLDYATEQQAQRIISFCGAEPFCEGGQLTLQQEVSWYKEHGFIHDHNVMGVTPCMVRELLAQDADEPEGRMRMLSKNPRYEEPSEPATHKTTTHKRC